MPEISFKKMNVLLEKFLDFKGINNFTFEYELETGYCLKYKLKQADFPNLIGLHKLIDIPLIRQFNDKNNLTITAKYLLKKIKKEQILTDETIKNSLYFEEIKDRYNSFSKDKLLTISYKDAIIDFDKNVINSNLNADYILFEEKNNEYDHLCVAKDKNGCRYVESFFHNKNDFYLKGQQIVKIKSVKIFDDKGHLYFKDIFIK